MLLRLLKKVPRLLPPEQPSNKLLQKLLLIMLNPKKLKQHRLLLLKLQLLMVQPYKKLLLKILPRKVPMPSLHKQRLLK